MPYKPVGVDDAGHFPPRVQTALKEMFVTKPTNVQNGQVPVWNSTLKTWVGVDGGGTPSNVDGGIWDPTKQAWVAGN